MQQSLETIRVSPQRAAHSYVRQALGSSPNRKKGDLTAFYQRLSLLCCATALDFRQAAIGSKYSVREPLLLLKVYVLALVLLKLLLRYILHVELALL